MAKLTKQSRKLKPRSASQEMCDALDAQDIHQIQLLIQNGESPNAFYDRDIYERSYTTLLAKAAREGYVEVVRVLLEHGADTKIPCDAGETPLTQACFRGCYEVVELLIQYGANVHYKTPNRWMAIHWCETNENKNKANYQRIAQLLLQHMYPKIYPKNKS